MRERARLLRMTRHPSASWWLKVKRAQKHLRELEREIRRPTKRNPYTEEFVVEPDGDYYRWRSRLQMTDELKQRLAIIVGDVLHNLRTALDHCAVAVAPRERERLAGFPIFTEDFWLEDRPGHSVRGDDMARQGRRTYRRQTDEMPDDALAIIEAAQPYKAASDPGLTPLGLLAQLENADKHRRLLITQYVFDISHLPWIGPDGEPLKGPYSQATMSLEASGSVADPKVNVQLGRRVSVAIKVSDEEGHFLAVPTLQLIEGEVGKVLRDLEPFVHAGIAARP